MRTITININSTVFRAYEYTGRCYGTALSTKLILHAVAILNVYTYIVAVQRERSERAVTILLYGSRKE